MTEWRNWSGNVRASPTRTVTPADEAAVQDTVARAERDGLTVRPAGAGHSFTPLCATDGVLIDLSALSGVESIDAGAGTATVLGGTRLSALGEPLRRAGLALHNQGDVDTQTITGAIGTGTHGTGPALGNLSTAVVAARVVGDRGELRTCSASESALLFEAARLSLGAAGIITAVTLQCVPAYNLHERTWFESADTALPRLAERIAATRHYEFWWHPQRDLCEHKSLEVVDAEPDELPDRKRERIGESYRIFPSVRDRRFNEMEYAVPSGAGPACFREIRALVRTRHPQLDWPVEYRTVAADRLWLSPAHGRETVTISVHEAADRKYDPLFRDCEAVFRAHAGRPHWGKVHGARAEGLADLYPRWADFWRAVAGADPHGRFLNEYLHALRGEEVSV